MELAQEVLRVAQVEVRLTLRLDLDGALVGGDCLLVVLLHRLRVCQVVVVLYALWVDTYCFLIMSDSPIDFVDVEVSVGEIIVDIRDIRINLECLRIVVSRFFVVLIE